MPIVWIRITRALLTGSSSVQPVGFRERSIPSFSHTRFYVPELDPRVHCSFPIMNQPKPWPER
jgi:hypothetical protein